VRREWLSEAALIERINDELIQYPACAGCRISNLRIVGIRDRDECNWVPYQVTTPLGRNNSYLSVLARIICDFQGRYSVADSSGARRVK